MILTSVTLRELTPEERQALEQLASSRTAQARFVERAQILLAIAGGQRPSQVARQVGRSRHTVYTWIHRFNEQGLRGLEDRPRAGRPPTYTAEQRAEVIATALTDPQRLELPFGCWTLDRLQAYLNEQKGIPIKRSRIDEILLAEGLRWRHQETWFGERVDPAFAEKRGSSSGSTRPRRRARSSSASTRWAQSRPRASRGSNSSTPSRRYPAAPHRKPVLVPPRHSRVARPGSDTPSGPSKRSTTGGVARGTSSAPSAQRPARP
jgi:transposase